MISRRNRMSANHKLLLASILKFCIIDNVQNYLKEEDVETHIFIARILPRNSDF